MTWLEHLGLSHSQGAYILAQSRRAEDDQQVQCATIVSVKNGTAIVERYGWDGARLLDYPVRVRP